MAISECETKRVEKAMEAYLERTRPPVHIRNELDIGYRIDNHSVELFEIRPAFQNPNKKSLVRRICGSILAETVCQQRETTLFPVFYLTYSRMIF